MLTNILTYGALGAIGLYLFGSNDMHEMLFGLGMMLVAVLGYMMGDHIFRMVPVVALLEGKINTLDSKLDGLARDLDSIERRLKRAESGPDF
jgi:hypothetical protein